MKRIGSLICCLCLVSSIFALSSCKLLLKGNYQFLREREEIASIEIVRIGSYLDNITLEPRQTVLSKIENIDEFMNDFSKVNCSERFSDPTNPSEGETAIKIIYDGGEYELICRASQALFFDGIYHAEKGFYSFDQEQFEALITKYKAR